MLDHQLCEEDFKTPTERYAPYAATTLEIKGIGVLVKLKAGGSINCTLNSTTFESHDLPPTGEGYVFMLERDGRRYSTPLLRPCEYKKAMQLSIRDFLKKILFLDTCK